MKYIYKGIEYKCYVTIQFCDALRDIIQDGRQVQLHHNFTFDCLGHGLLFHFSIDLSVLMKFSLTGDFPAWRVFQNSGWPPRAKIETKTHNFNQKSIFFLQI